MSDATAFGGSRSKASHDVRAILRMAVLGMIWAAFLSWCWRALQGSALNQVRATLESLGMVLLTYLVALTVWIVVRTWLHQVKAERVAEPFEEPAFTKDYFGRAVSVAAGASFGDQHLVLEYADGKKRYRAPAIEEEEESAAASSLRMLAAAAGADSSISPERAPEQTDESGEALGRELDARDIRSH